MSIDEDTLNTMEDVQYCRGISSLLWRVFGNTEGYHHYYGGYSVLRWYNISTVEGYNQYCSGHSWLWRDTIST